MNGKVLMLAIIFLGGFHVFYAFNRVQNFANIMYRLCAIQLGECLISFLKVTLWPCSVLPSEVGLYWKS